MTKITIFTFRLKKDSCLYVLFLDFVQISFILFISMHSKPEISTKLFNYSFSEGFPETRTHVERHREEVSPTEDATERHTEGVSLTRKTGE
jgi:hypothetical protein